MIDAAGQLKMIGIDPREETRFLVRKRDGRNEEFNEARIFMAIECAFKAVLGILPDLPLPAAEQVAVLQSADAVAERVLSGAIKGEPLEVERIQDVVEEQLMRDGHWRVARSYILYREERRRAQGGTGKTRRARPAFPNSRDLRAGAGAAGSGALQLPDLGGGGLPRVGGPVFGRRLGAGGLAPGTAGHPGPGKSDATGRGLAPALADPAYDTVAARLLLRSIYRQALPQWVEGAEMEPVFRRGFSDYIRGGVDLAAARAGDGRFRPGISGQRIAVGTRRPIQRGGAAAFIRRFSVAGQRAAPRNPPVLLDAPGHGIRIARRGAGGPARARIL